ncbi:MAG: hypothetical protein LBS32_08300 [Clostridiales Family XIII bacterium]|jgi:hypothetical protein|nr:hypothetical protein [Clostridiales Family XIII bacterium]
MQFLISHWHCVLPALGIVAAMFFMREKPEKRGKSDGGRQEWTPASRDYDDR